MRPRWHKALADLWSNKMRSLLVIVSIAIGLFAVGLISTTHAWLGLAIDAAANKARQSDISGGPDGPRVMMIPTDEELMIARHTQRVLGTT